MKILHVCTGWPLSYKGGITNYVRSIAQAQYEAGNEVYVLGAPDEAKYEFTYIEYTSKMIPFTYSPLVDKEGLIRIDCILKEKKFDIIHLHALEKVDWDLYLILKPYHYVVSLHDYCFICPRVYMYTCKGEVCEAYNEQRCKRCISYLERYRYVRALNHRMSKLLQKNVSVPHVPQKITTERYRRFRILLNNADFILPVSKKVEEIYRESGICSKSRVLHIGNASTDDFSSSIDYKLDEHVIKIVFLGRLTVYKGAELFIRIANDLKNSRNIEFHFLGNPGEYAEKIEKAGIINHGKYNPDDLKVLLHDYDMGMVLSIWHDNGPQVVMELLNNHVPVIGTKMGGIPDFVNNSNGRIFDPYSELEIKELEQFINDLTPAKIYQLKKNIQRTTTIKEHYQQLMEVYNEVFEYGKK